MLRRVTLVRTDVSEELSASFIRVTRIGELGTTLMLVTASVVPGSPILVTPMKEALSSSETLVLTRATRPNIPEDAILQKWAMIPGDSGYYTIIYGRVCASNKQTAQAWINESTG
jgi:hypothetical protein